MREILFRAWDPLKNKMWKYAMPMFEGKYDENASEQTLQALEEIRNILEE